jgi:hypothetical protein
VRLDLDRRLGSLRSGAATATPRSVAERLFLRGVRPPAAPRVCAGRGDSRRGCAIRRGMSARTGPCRLGSHTPQNHPPLDRTLRRPRASRGPSRARILGVRPLRRPPAAPRVCAGRGDSRRRCAIRRGMGGHAAADHTRRGIIPRWIAQFGARGPLAARHARASSAFARRTLRALGASGASVWRGETAFLHGGIGGGGAGPGGCQEQGAACCTGRGSIPPSMAHFRGAGGGRRLGLAGRDGVPP